MSERRSYELTLVINVDHRRMEWRWVAMTLVGTLWVLLSLPHGATKLAAREGWGWIEPFARFSVFVNSLVPEFAFPSSGWEFSSPSGCSRSRSC